MSPRIPVVQFECSDSDSGSEAEAVRRGLDGWNSRFAPPCELRPLAVYARRADGSLLGGLLGVTYWGWLCIERLWVDDESRGSGIGGGLLAAAETEAVRRGCRAVHVDTHDFQAPGFYHKHGYRECGRLEGLPPGHVRYLLRKDLAGSSVGGTGG